MLLTYDHVRSPDEVCQPIYPIGQPCQPEPADARADTGNCKTGGTDGIDNQAVKFKSRKRDSLQQWRLF